jgi:hypothetical protein
MKGIIDCIECGRSNQVCCSDGTYDDDSHDNPVCVLCCEWHFAEVIKELADAKRGKVKCFHAGDSDENREKVYSLVSVRHGEIAAELWEAKRAERKSNIPINLLPSNQ